MIKPEFTKPHRTRPPNKIRIQTMSETPQKLPNCRTPDLRSPEPPKVSPSRLRELAQPNFGRFLAALVCDWTVILIALAVTAKFPTWWVIGPAMFVLGTRLHALGVLGHEATHYCITRNRKLNDTLGALFCFWPLGGSLTGYRHFHQRHHRHLGTDQDPERHFYQSEIWKIPVAPGKPLRRFFEGCIGGHIVEFGKLLQSLLPRNHAEWLGIPLWWATFAITLGLLGHLWLLGVYAITIPTVFWALVELRGWTEHRGIAETHRYQTHWLIREILFPHNVWMHYEHHQWCYIPFYNLPAARELDDSTPVVALKEVFDFLGETDHDQYAARQGYTLTPDHFSGPTTEPHLRKELAADCPS